VLAEALISKGLPKRLPGKFCVMNMIASVNIEIAVSTFV
jgi:hypothetical protein